MRPPSPPKVESEAMAAINEIFNPTYKKPITKGNYRAPDEVSAGDQEAMKDLDIRKLAELKEVEKEWKMCEYCANDIIYLVLIGIFAARLGQRRLDFEG